MSTNANKATIRRFFEQAYNAGNVTVVDELISPQAIDHTPANANSPEAVKFILSIVQHAFPNIHVDVEDLIADGDRVAVRVTVRATHLGEYAGIPPTGKRVVWDGIEIFRLADGQIVETWGGWDDQSLLRQLRALPVPDDFARAAAPEEDSLAMSITLPATLEQVYTAWLSTEKHSAFTGSPAAVDAKVGGAFTAWDGYIGGTTLALEPYRRIVQAWRTTEFPDDAPDSRLEILIEPAEGGTRLTLDHTGIPIGQADDYRQGWEDFYFGPLAAYFGR
jgi:steroid delta-isomerase-like uncharacterized protein